MVSRKWCRLRHTERRCAKERRTGRGIPHCQSRTRTDWKVEFSRTLRTA